MLKIGKKIKEYTRRCVDCGNLYKAKGRFQSAKYRKCYDCRNKINITQTKGFKKDWSQQNKLNKLANKEGGKE